MPMKTHGSLARETAPDGTDDGSDGHGSVSESAPAISLGPSGHDAIRYFAPARANICGALVSATNVCESFTLESRFACTLI